MLEDENKVDDVAIEVESEKTTNCEAESDVQSDAENALKTEQEETEEIVDAVEQEDASVSLHDIVKTLVAVDEKIEQMNQLFVRKIQHTTHEEKIVDQMHAELQRYKEDMYSQLVRPILLDIIEVRDSIIRISNNFALKPEGEQDVPLKTFSGYAFDIQDILEKNNITIYDSKDGDDFNALKQRVIKKVSTPVEQLHGKIAESLSSGYDYMGRAISPEKVAVYIYQKPEDAEGEN